MSSLLKLTNLSKEFHLFSNPWRKIFHTLGLCGTGNSFRTHHALQNISFELKKGECLGIIGPNGAGKSTLLKIISNCLYPTSGELETNGRLLSLLELGAGFNFNLTGRENIYASAQLLGYTKREVENHIKEIEEFADLKDFFDRPLKLYSSGMFARLGFAMYSHLPCDIFIIDETFAVGDVFFVQKCFQKIEALLSKQVSIILVSHDMASIAKLCDQTMVLFNGKMEFLGNSREAISKYYYLDSQGKNQMEPETFDQVACKNETLTNWPTHDNFINIEDKIFKQAEHFKIHKFFVGHPSGKSSFSFEVNETCMVCYEVEVLKFIGVPIGSITIWNNKNIPIYGKSTYQINRTILSNAKVGSKIRIKHIIPLQIASGIFTIELGMAGASQHIIENINTLPEKVIHDSVIRDAICNSLASITIHPPKSPQKNDLHHGLVNLNSSIFAEIIEP